MLLLTFALVNGGGANKIMKRENYRVYILDDDAEDADLLAEAFENTEYDSEIHLFNTPNKLLQQLFFLPSDKVPDLIVMDHQMPLMDGSNMVKHIRADKKLKDITLGIYSSGIQEAKLKDMFRSGIDIFIEKGNTCDEIKYHIKKFFEAVEVKHLNGGG